MKIDVCVPTLGERDLSRLLDSIDVPYNLLLDKGSDGCVKAVNRMLATSTGEAAIVIADDFEFLPGSIGYAIEAMQVFFPRLDGVIAFKTNTEGPDTTCMMIGREFLKRFPNQQAFCPSYFHFYVDTELGLFARSLGRLLICDSAPVIHYHAEKYDNTFYHARSHKKEDIATWERRQKERKLWGATFEP